MIMLISSGDSKLSIANTSVRVANKIKLWFEWFREKKSDRASEVF